jgi:hypothetical protein
VVIFLENLVTGWVLLLVVISFICGFIFAKILYFLSGASLSIKLVKSANLCALYMFVKSFERITYYNNLALNDYIQSGANERNVEVYKNNLDEEAELFKTRCVGILIESHPDIFKNVISFDDWASAMYYLNSNRDFVLQLFKGKDA